MNIDDLVEYIKCEGCRVRVYSSKSLINGGNAGTFSHDYEGGPLICLATKGTVKRKIVEILLHEFGHYLQWRDGFMDFLDGICDAYYLEEKWINHKIELGPFELKTVRNTILSMEYDAERRAIMQGKLLKPVDFDLESYYQGASAYMDAIKWSFLRRKTYFSAPRRTKYKKRLLTFEELYEPLQEEKLKWLDKEMKYRNPEDNYPLKTL